MASIADILLAQGQQQAESRRARAGKWVPLMQHLASLPGQFMQDRQSERAAQESAFDRQQQRDVRTQQVAKGERELDAAEKTAEQKQQMNALIASDGVIDPDGRISIPRGQEIARANGYGGNVLADFLAIAQANNANIEKGGRERILFDQQQTDRRQDTNQQGVRRMIGESIAGRNGEPISTADRQTYQGMALQEGVDLPAGALPEPVPEEEVSMVVRGPNGRPTRMMVPKSQLRNGGVEEYREPSTAGSNDTEWVTRNGTPAQIRKGTAQAGDVPYSAPKSTSETAQDRQRKGRLESARGFLERLNELRENINTKIGPAAGLTGMARQIKAGMGLDPDVAEYERVRAAGGRALAVAIMGAQNLSDADASAWSNMLPGARIDAVTAKRLTDQIGKMLEDTDTAAPTPKATDQPPPDSKAPTAADLIKKYGG